MIDFDQNKAAIGLDQPKFYSLNKDSWFAVATLTNGYESLVKNNAVVQQKKQQRQLQRLGTRQLLNALLCQLNLQDELLETSFPYRLKNSAAFVCFSHSKLQVAVAISQHQAIGIDIEAQAISWQVAKRYFHPNEVAQLINFDRQTRQIISQLLWQIKESIIKIEQFTLAQGLGKDYSALILPIQHELLKKAATFTLPLTLANHKSYQAQILLKHHLAVVF